MICQVNSWAHPGCPAIFYCGWPWPQTKAFRSDDQEARCGVGGRLVVPRIATSAWGQGRKVRGAACRGALACGARDSSDPGVQQAARGVDDGSHHAGAEPNSAGHRRGDGHQPDAGARCGAPPGDRARPGGAVEPHAGRSGDDLLLADGTARSAGGTRRSGGREGRPADHR